MDEESFEFNAAQVREVVRRFPAHVLERASAVRNTDLSFLRNPTERVKHLWDEGGH